MKFKVLFFVNNWILYLQKKDKKNNIKKNTNGPKLLKAKKKYLMVISGFQGPWVLKSCLNNSKILSKFVSIQNQIDKMKSIFIQ